MAVLWSSRLINGRCITHLKNVTLPIATLGSWDWSDGRTFGCHFSVVDRIVSIINAERSDEPRHSRNYVVSAVEDQRLDSVHSMIHKQRVRKISLEIRTSPDSFTALFTANVGKI